MSMRTHHNQIDVKAIRLEQDFLGYHSRRLMQCDLESALSDFFLPLSQLRFLAFIARQCLWHWIKHGNRHTRHRCKLWHPRQAVTKRAGRYGCTEFCDVDEMNL